MFAYVWLELVLKKIIEYTLLYYENQYPKTYMNLLSVFIYKIEIKCSKK